MAIAIYVNISFDKLRYDKLSGLRALLYVGNWFGRVLWCVEWVAVLCWGLRRSPQRATSIIYLGALFVGADLIQNKGLAFDGLC